MSAAAVVEVCRRDGCRWWHPDHARHARAWRPPEAIPVQPPATHTPPATIAVAPARATGRLTEPRTEWRVIDGREVKVTIGPQPAREAAPPEPIFGCLAPGRYYYSDTAVARAYSTGRDA